MLLVGFSASPSLSQTFPVSDADGLTSYRTWERAPEGLVASVLTDGEGGWAKLSVIRTYSMGASLDTVEFSFETGVHEPGYIDLFKKVLGKERGKAVSLEIDGRRFSAAHAVYGKAESGGLRIDMSFTPMAEEDGVLQPSEPNCQVTKALLNARTISVRYPGVDGSPEDSYALTGKGSSAALDGVAC
jgi:hypothetical protein